MKYSLLFLLLLTSCCLTSCGGQVATRNYSTIPTTNNPSITRDSGEWRPGASY